jgi:hypothetical protein
MLDTVPSRAVSWSMIPYAASESAQGIASGHSLLARICAGTRAFAISSRVWDMEHSWVGVVGIDRHASNRMAMTTRSRCRRRLNRSPIPFIQPYFCRSKACPCAAVVASTMVASASIHRPVTVPRMVQGAIRIRGWRCIRFTSQRSPGCRHTGRHGLPQTRLGSGRASHPF